MASSGRAFRRHGRNAFQIERYSDHRQTRPSTRLLSRVKVIGQKEEWVILAWGKIAPHLAIWDYWISYGLYRFPTPDCMIQCIGPDLKLFADMHAETIFCESEEDHEPKIAGLAALLRDPQLPEPFRRLPTRDVADFNWLTFSPYTPGRQNIVADAEAAGGMAAALVAAADDAHKQPLTFGITGGPTFTLPPEEVPQDGKCHVFKVGPTRGKKRTTAWAHASRRRGVNVDRLVVPEAQDPTVNDWEAYISLKVKGPAYVKGSTDSNGLWMDRVILVRTTRSHGK